MKYKLTGESKTHEGVTLHRIRAVRNVGDSVKTGDIGGWIEGEHNLSQRADSAWIYNEAIVYGAALVCDSAVVSGSAYIYGSALVYESAEVSGQAWVFGSARIYGSAWVYGSALIFDEAHVCDSARVYGEAQIYGLARIRGSSRVYEGAQVHGSAGIGGLAIVSDSERSGRVPITVIRSDGLTFAVVKRANDATTIRAGHRYFSISDARAHCAANHADTKLGKESLVILDFLERISWIEERWAA